MELGKPVGVVAPAAAASIRWVHQDAIIHVSVRVHITV